MTIIRNDKQLGGQTYPMLAGLNWHILSTKLGDKKAVKERLLNTQDIAFRHIKDAKLMDLYVEGITSPNELLQKLHLSVSLDKGEFVMSKRWSRIMRPYYYWRMFKPKDVSIEYHAEWDKAQWDGAMLIRRGFLPEMLKHVPPDRRLALKRTLLECGRVEVTILSRQGEDKGHALVVDDLPCDIMLPCDTKLEVKRTDNQIFIGLNPVHCKQHTWLDFQSMINLVPFLKVPMLLNWLKEEGDRFLADIQAGKFDAIFEALPINADLRDWPVQEYLACGGHSMHFSAIFKALANQHLKMVRARSLNKSRVPIPAGRYYVFCDTVGGKHLPKGRCEFDDAAATIWVSREDWPEVVKILGGCDQDDSFLCLPFRDWDGTLKVLVWRNPNQLGEYMLLEPTEVLAWAEYPELDSRELPQRIDERAMVYLDLIEKTPTFQGRKYSIKGMDRAIRAALKNLGMPGIHVNLQMALKALTGTLPVLQPASMEAIIDAGQKNGDDLLPVKKYDIDYARAYFLKHNHVPLVLHPRILGMLKRDQRDLIEPTFDHWLDVYCAGIQAHLQAYKKRRDEIALTCFPPIEVLAYGKTALQPAARLKEAYAAIIRKAAQENKLTDEVFVKARDASEAIFLDYPQDQWTALVAGVMTRSYVIGDEGVITSDSVAWQMGKRVDNLRKRGIIHVTLRMLREVGAIAELVDTDQGYVRYYEGTNIPQGEVVQMRGVWFAMAKYKHPEYQVMGDVPQPIRKQFKQIVETRCQQDFYVGQTFQVRLEGERTVLYNGEHLVAYVRRGDEAKLGLTFTPKLTVAVDGNALCCITPRSSNQVFGVVNQLTQGV